MQNTRPGFCIKCDRWVLKGEGTEKEKNGVKIVYCKECERNGKSRVQKQRSK